MKAIKADWDTPVPRLLGSVYVTGDRKLASMMIGVLSVYGYRALESEVDDPSDRQRIATLEVFWLVGEPDAANMFRLGAAIGLRKRIVMSGWAMPEGILPTDASASLFFHQGAPDALSFELHSEALEFFRNHARDFQ